MKPAHRRSCPNWRPCRDLAPAPSPARPGARAAPAAEHATPAAEEFDHEIANIYSEEATELLEAAEVSLTAWNKDRKDKNRVAELQRQLHTLKGGARMAGITAMGDLSHELETLVMQIDGGQVAGDDLAHSVMQSSLDQLAHMRESVSRGVLPPAAGPLIARIRELASPGRAAERHARPAQAPSRPASRPRLIRGRNRLASVAQPEAEHAAERGLHRASS
jgi:chemosensory pili system protein ChpA (sensor histidine kinase/response regulator)